MVRIKPDDIVDVFRDVRVVAALAKALAPFIKQTVEEAVRISIFISLYNLGAVNHSCTHPSLSLYYIICLSDFKGQVADGTLLQESSEVLPANAVTRYR